MGANNSIQHAGVQYIIDSVITELVLNPQRKFIYVEMAFFMRWWREQTPQQQQLVRNLVSEGRLEFINGGWAMNDEACVHYQATIDQMTLGHQFLMDNFGVTPTMGWQIDPFGHSATFPALLAQMGFEGIFNGRIDYQDRNKRRADQTMEFIWSPTRSQGHNDDIWTGILYNHYCPPSGFNWDVLSDDNPVQDDPNLEDMNVAQLSDEFAATMREYSSSFKHNEVLVPMGCDFEYENANEDFKNIEKLMAYMNPRNESYRMQLFYSTPSQYLAAVRASTLQTLNYTVTNNDFFPYADAPYQYWTGYFTSRPALKGYIRTRSAFLHAAEQLHTVSKTVFGGNAWKSQLTSINTLQQAMGVNQHHDAVSGTEKQHVTDDYAKQLSIGTASAAQTVANNTYLLLRKSPDTPQPAFQACPLANVTICPVSNATLSNPQQTLVLVIYNNLAWERNEVVLVPVPVGNLQVSAADGAILPSEVHANPQNANFTLAFAVAVPPLGFTTVFIAQSATNAPIRGAKPSPGADVVLQNAFYTVTFSGKTNALYSVQLKAQNATVMLDQTFKWYNASAGNNKNSSQASGAYIFRPNNTFTYPYLPFPATVDPLTGQYSSSAVPSLWVSQGALVSLVFQTFSPWVQQLTRVYANASFLEVENMVGPIDISDGLGKEVITQYTTSFASKGAWYSDSNGQEMQWRQRNYRETFNLAPTNPIAANYYPVNTAVFINDTSSGLRLTIAVDRSEGCASIQDGQLEVMLHRRLLYDDHKGVGEPLNETDAIRTLHRVSLADYASASVVQRTQAQLLNNPLLLQFVASSSPLSAAISSWNAQFSDSFSPLSGSLPPNVELLSLQTLASGLTIFRLHHLYAVGENPVYSQPVSVDLSKLFTSPFVILAIEETQLTAVRPLSQIKRAQWNSLQGVVPTQPQISPVNIQQLSVTLNPMQTRTFLIQFQQ